MPRRSIQRDPVRTPGRNFEENRALCGPVHVARILGTPPDELKPESEPVKSQTAPHDEVTRPCRSSSPASTGGSVPVGDAQQGVRSIHQHDDIAEEEVADGDAAAPAPLDAAADPLGTELTPDPVASPARSKMSKIPLAAPESSTKPARTPLRQSPGSKLPTPRRRDTQDTPSSPIGRERHGRRTRQDTRQGTPFGIAPEGWGRATGGAINMEARFHSRPQ